MDLTPPPPGTLILANTILADGIGGTVDSASAYNNLIGTDDSGGLVNGVNGNQVGVDPRLDPNGLQDNGGPTQTIALLPDSPAINAGDNALAVDPATKQPLWTDQRGFSRIVGFTVDIGAYEVQEVQNSLTAGACGWGTQTATLQTAADGLRLLPAGRSTDLPWLGVDQLQISLKYFQPLWGGGGVTVTSVSGINYGPVTVTGGPRFGMDYTITLAQPITKPDRVTVTIDGAGQFPNMTRELDVLPGDVNDDGVVNSQDLVLVRNQWLGINGTKPTIFGDINGDGVVNSTDYNDVRKAIGTTLPPVGGDPIVSGGSGAGAIVGGGQASLTLVVPLNSSPSKTSQRPAAQAPRPRAELQLALRGRGWSLGDGLSAKLVNQPIPKQP
jgi:hypothetical protein